MRRESWLVRDNGLTPDRPLEECMYCRAPVETEHKPDCVMRKRTVVLRATVEYVKTVSEDDTVESILFRYNEGTWCMDNVLEDIERHLGGEDSPFCLCGTQLIGVRTEDEHGSKFVGNFVRTPFDSKIEFVREATPEDERFSAIRAAEVPHS